MKWPQIILGLILIIILSSCATPNINIVKESGFTMELDKSAYRQGALAFSPDGKHAVAGGEGTKLYYWNVSTGKRENVIDKGSYGVDNALAISHDGKYVVSGMRGRSNLKIWAVDSGQLIREFRGHVHPLAPGPGDIIGTSSVSFLPDDSMILSGGVDKAMRLWDIKDGRNVVTLQVGQPGFLDFDGISSLALSPDGKYVLSGSYYGLVTLWDVSGLRKILDFTGHAKGFNEEIRSIAFFPDMRYAMSAGRDKTIKIWDIHSGNEIKTLDGNQGQVLSAAVSPDGKYIVSGGLDSTIKLWDVATGKEIRTLKGHKEGFAQGVFKVSFSYDGKFVFSGATDAAIRTWDSRTGEELAMLVSFRDGEWIAITSEGYYNASENGAKYLSVKMGGNTYDIEKFYDVFYRPDIVAAKLQGKDIKELITITMEDAAKTPPPMVEFISQTASSDQQKLKVCYQVKSTGGGIGEVRLFHNGKLTQSDGYYRELAKSPANKIQLASLNSKTIYEDMRSVSIKSKIEFVPTSIKSKGDIFQDCKEVETIFGENEISVAAFNSSNTVQGYLKTIKFDSTLKSEDPHLYILSIGIDKYKDNAINLKYAAKDATDIKEKLLKQSATIYKPQNIHYELLTDDGAGKEKITSRINSLSQVITPNDGFILFVAGHGVLLQNQYYMLTHDYDGNVSNASMISSNELVEMSKKIKSLSQLFIFDTCHAGGVDTIVSGLYDARMSVLAKKMGLHIYASASTKEVAMDGYQGNGLFTHALLEGLNNKKEADKNNDGKISLVELGDYAKQETATTSKNLGNQQTPLIINFGKDSPVYQLR